MQRLTCQSRTEEDATKNSRFPVMHEEVKVTDGASLDAMKFASTTRRS